MTVAIVDYGSGNLHSAAKAFERAAQEAVARNRSWSPATPTSCAGPIAWCCRALGRSRTPRGLDAIAGMVEVLNETVHRQGKPFLGICVGMQLMAERAKIMSYARARLDRRRGRSHRAGRSEPGSAHGMEHSMPPPRCSTASRWDRAACTPISCSYQFRVAIPRIWSRKPITVAPSPQSSAVTPSPAHSFTRKRASGSGLRLSPTS